MEYTPPLFAIILTIFKLASFYDRLARYIDTCIRYLVNILAIPS